MTPLLDDLVRSHRRRLFSLALARVGRVADAEDVVQTVLLRVVRRGGLAGVSDPAAYLVAAVENLCRNVRSRARPQASLDLADGPAAQSTGSSVAERELGDVLRAAIHALPESERVPVWLVHVEGLRPREVAQLCGIAPLTVKSQLARGRRRLRERLGPLLRKAGYLAL